MANEPTVAGSTVLSAFRVLAREGIDETVMEEQIGLAKRMLEAPDARVPVTVWNQFLEKGRQWSKAPDFALHLGEVISHSRMSVVGHVVFNSRTAGEGIRQYIRFIKLANEGDRVDLEIEKDTVALVYTTEDPDYFSPLAIERNFSLAVTRLRKYTNTGISPLRVDFTHPEPDYIDAYKKVFQAQIYFDQKKNRLVYPRTVLDLKIGRRSAHLYSGLVNHAETLLEKLLRRRSVSRKARRWIEKHIADAGIDIETIAGKMYMSRQTLYRKLKKEGTSFKILHDEARKRKAVEYLERSDHSVSEIAFLLGFSQISSFDRAFKRWYGRNPTEHRESINI